MPQSEQPVSAIKSVLDVFRGAKVIAARRPLFCWHCDADLASEYKRSYDSNAPMQDLVTLIQSRRGAIVERTWPDGRRDWMCHRCGREVKNQVQKKGARANVPQKKGEEIRCEQDHSTGKEPATSTGQSSQEHAQAGAQEEGEYMSLKFIEPSEGNGWFKFSKPGDRIAAKFISRRVGVKTPKQESANILVVDVLESTIIDDDNREVDGPTGRRSINESGHLTQIFDEAKLQPDEGFFLCFASKDPKKGFKKFGFERMSQEQLDGYNGPPPDFFDDAR